MMEKRKMISGGFVQGIEQEEMAEQVSDVKELDRNGGKICAECGNTLKLKAKFCRNCGTLVQEKLQYSKQQQMEQPVITKDKAVKI